jgi:hypothetical protein
MKAEGFGATKGLRQLGTRGPIGDYFGAAEEVLPEFGLSRGKPGLFEKAR